MGKRSEERADFAHAFRSRANKFAHATPQILSWTQLVTFGCHGRPVRPCGCSGFAHALRTGSKLPVAPVF